MASLRVRWAHNGGHAFSSSLNSEPHSCVGWSRYFSRQVMNKNLLMVRKPDPHQQMAQGRLFRLSVAANRGDTGMNRTSNSSSFDHLIRSDGTSAAWSEISNVCTKKRIIDKEEDNSKKLDQWMTDSVVEIVNNIGRGPLLVHIYSDDTRKESPSKAAIRLVIEKAVAERWPIISGRWDDGRSPTPNGVILVEELQSKDVAVSLDEEKRNDIGSNNQLHTTTRIWGLLIQAKGLNCTACYILKTSRVQTFLGFCTHFCLVRVDCFVENAETQLKKLWLQR